MLNKVMLIGNLGADPELRYTQSGTAVAQLRIATTKRYKDRESGEQVEKTEWHRVVLWRRLGEIAGEYLKKGSKVFIEGELQTRKWQDNDGNDRYTTEIVGNEMKMLDSRGANNQGGFNEGGFGQSQAKKPAAQAEAIADVDNFDDDDIPF